MINNSPTTKQIEDLYYEINQATIKDKDLTLS